ncbi:hypothetical protein EV44_g3384 [Erysiphe necator]|uniref:Uncharacterized protein n=1 Tax=Uncinula necator TaxID=52586 RepID=A0A0B1PEA5_UNCNE|nr:hypothetical protein EV44_g3384 [Erysiphe necator]
MKGLSRKPSDKVEALFHKGMDQKKRDKSQNYESCIFPMIKNEYNNTESQKILLAMQKELNNKNEAKFLNTRKKFETNFSPEESTQHDNCMSVEQDKNNIQPFKHKNKLSRGLINEQRSYSFESPQQQCRYARAESVPHEVAENHAIDKGGARLVEGGTQIFQLTQENLQHKNRTKSGAFREHNAIDTIPTNSQDTTLLTPAKTIPIPSCGLVEEKVKHFEKIRSTGKTGTIPTKRSITRRLNRSLRGFFDFWDSNEKIRVKNENSSKDELNGSRKEFQSVGSQKIKARDILNNDVVSSKNLSKMKNKFLGNSGKSSESSSLDEMDVWIIKKVDCGLKQPKPLRAVEIKSMVLLCSSYGGGNKISSISN